MTKMNLNVDAVLFEDLFVLATHSGVLCGVAVDTATLSCWDFDVWARLGRAVATAKSTATGPIRKDL